MNTSNIFKSNPSLATSDPIIIFIFSPFIFSSDVAILISSIEFVDIF